MTFNDRSRRSPAVQGRITPQPVVFSPEIKAQLVMAKARMLLEQGTEIVPNQEEFLLYMRQRTLQDHLEAFEKARRQLERSTHYLHRRVNRHHREELAVEAEWPDVDRPTAQPEGQLVETLTQRAG